MSQIHQNVGKECKVKKTLGKKLTAKIVALMVKRDKPATKGNGKIKQPEVTRVELRVDGDFHMSEKPGWSAVDIEK